MKLLIKNDHFLLSTATFFFNICKIFMVVGFLNLFPNTEVVDPQKGTVFSGIRNNHFCKIGEIDLCVNTGMSEKLG